MAEKKELKKIPGFSQGVRVNAAGRMVKMAVPICPNSKMEFISTPEGRRIPKQETDPHRQNCQKLGHGWWKYCEEQGHDPYFTTKVWYEKVPDYGPDPDNPGDTILLKERTVKRETKYPNISQVAAYTHVNGGRGVIFSMERKGFKRLREIGYEEVCQFRNCQKEIKFTSKVGQYCSQEHAALVAADAQSLFLLQYTGRFEAGAEMEAQQKRARGLIEASQFANIRPIE